VFHAKFEFLRGVLHQFLRVGVGMLSSWCLYSHAVLQNLVRTWMVRHPHMLRVATVAKCGVRRVCLHVGIPTVWGLHPVKCIAIAKAAGNTFVPFTSSPQAFIL